MGSPNYMQQDTRLTRIKTRGMVVLSRDHSSRRGGYPMAYDDVYRQVIEEYQRTGSVRQAAQNVGTTLVRAQRILISEGLWSSPTSRNVGRLYAEGKTVAQIAAELYLSTKTVQAYLPYTRSPQGYGGDDRSADAVRSEAYRDHMHQAADRQVDREKFSAESLEQRHCEDKGNVAQEAVEGMRTMGQTVQENGAQEELSETRSSKACDGPRDTYHMQVLRLSLELDMPYVSPADVQVLQIYGKVDKAIRREILVPADMTLHALHYVIMRAFGWENSHLHHYSLPVETFNQLTGGTSESDPYGRMTRTGSVLQWADLCGIYFRYPTEDFDDIYWDDDYEEGMSFRTWLRRKYTGPYRYDGYGEHYRYAHDHAQWFLQSTPQMRRGDVSIADVEMGFEMRMDELLERLQIRDVLLPADVDVAEDLEARCAKLAQTYETADDQEQLHPLPVTHELRYAYDYGDGWQVRIRMDDGYEIRETVYNARGILQDDALAAQVLEVQAQRRPMYMVLDGLPVMDDVGGIHGYINYLQTIHEGDPEEAQECREWARGMGWTGRMSRPGTML